MLHLSCICVVLCLLTCLNLALQFLFACFWAYMASRAPDLFGALFSIAIRHMRQACSAEGIGRAGAGGGGRGPAKCEKKVHPNPEKRPERIKNTASLEVVAGQNEKKMQAWKILAGCPFQACLFFAFWSSSGFGCTFFSHFAGPGRISPKTCKQKCNAKFRHGSKHTKKRQAANARKLQHKN